MIENILIITLFIMELQIFTLGYILFKELDKKNE